MPAFIVRGIARDVTHHVRTTGRAPQYGHPVHREVATGTGPCRECLRTFTVGAEERLLFTYSPFDAQAHLPQPGPVFIHADDCAPHASDGYPDGLTAIRVVAECHNADGTVSEPHALTAGAEAVALEALLGTSHVRFLHLRHAEAGCFIARVDRVGV